MSMERTSARRAAAKEAVGCTTNAARTSREAGPVEWTSPGQISSSGRSSLRKFFRKRTDHGGWLGAKARSHYHDPSEEEHDFACKGAWSDAAGCCSRREKNPVIIVRSIRSGEGLAPSRIFCLGRQTSN